MENEDKDVNVVNNVVKGIASLLVLIYVVFPLVAFFLMIVVVALIKANQI